MFASRGAAWRTQRIATAPGADARIAGAASAAVLVESRHGAWIRLVVRAGSRWRTLKVGDAPKRALLGASGLTLDRAGRPAVAYALQEASERTSLHLVRLDARGRLVRTRVTTNGFPRSTRPPSALPVLWPDGSIRVVETFSQRGANALLWRREGRRWWGRVLYSSLLGLAPLPVYAAAPGGESFLLAWTVVYATGENHLVLSARPPPTSVVLHPNAFAAALALGSSGPEIGANEPVGPLVAGLLVGAVQTELDGRVLGYATAGAARQLLLARPDGLEWFSLPSPPTIRVTIGIGFTGRVEGVTSGTVAVYEEIAGAARRLAAEVAVAADGSFAAPVTPVEGAWYRAVYVDPATGVPYASLLRP